MANVATKGFPQQRSPAPVLDDAAGSVLLQTALAAPATALARARGLLDGRPHLSDASYAHQAAGIVLRDSGDAPGALRELRAGLRAAKRVGSHEREADVRATMGGTLVMAGRAREGLAELDLAARHARGAPLARIQLRRAHVLNVLGRHDEALDDLRKALAVVRQSGDVLWQARILSNRSLVHLTLGALGKADDDARAAELLFDQLGQALESAQAGHNRGIVAARRGDIPAALRLLDRAALRYADLGVLEPDLVIDTGQALLAAGLATEAVDAAATALNDGRRQPVKAAELLLFASAAGLADGQLEAARGWAERAHRMFLAQHRPTWQARARLLAGQSRFTSGERSARLQATLAEAATALEGFGSPESAMAHLLAGQVARHRGDDVGATSHFAAAAAHRRRGAPLTRATGWLAAALQDGDPRARLRACGRGLDALDEHLDAFGAAEFRATATSHGRNLAEVAIDVATRHGTPRAMLLWTERWRATALAQPAVLPTPDPRLEHSVGVSRDAARRPGAYGAKHEGELRRLRLQVSGGRTTRPRFDPGALLAALGQTRMVVLVPTAGMLQALVAADGRVTRHVVGPVDVATREVEFARFELRRVAHARRPTSPSTQARQRDLLQQALLGPVVRRLGDGPVVVVPPASLHPAPWGLLPALSDRAVSVAPSATSWLRATGRPSSGRAVSLVLGPGLPSGAVEIANLARVHPTSLVLGGEAGTAPARVDDVLNSLSGAWLAHLAAHGTFRADSPMFSSLAMDDGPLFVHDLDRMQHPPHRVVLSACDTGVAGPVGADELLGLVSSLLRLGTVGVLASVVPVNDAASVPFMVAVHEALVSGESMAKAALQGRRLAGDDPLAQATAASFNVWGV